MKKLMRCHEIRPKVAEAKKKDFSAVAIVGHDLLALYSYQGRRTL